MRLLIALIALTLFLAPMQAQAKSNYDYQLYKNHENYGIVVFPKKYIFKELSDYVSSLSFLEIESGKAVMRRGSKNENETLMMPLEVQKKHSIEKFIVIQVLSPSEMLVGIYDPEWGLTLPSAAFGMEVLMQNIPKTLNAFRGNNPQQQTGLERRERPVFVNFFRKQGYNASESTPSIPRQGGREVNARI